MKKISNRSNVSKITVSVDDYDLDGDLEQSAHRREPQS
jgi:hypothetical protein